MKRESKNAASSKAKPRIEKARHKKRGEKKGHRNSISLWARTDIR
jgi:hypothetical protein